MKTKIFPIFSTFFLAIGCTTSGGVLKMGPDTFKTSATNKFGDPAQAEQKALNLANDHCQKQGREILVTNTRSSNLHNWVTFEATFQCLTQNDPGLRRPTFEQAPAIVIKDERGKKP